MPEKTYFSHNQYLSKWWFATLILAATALWKPNLDQLGPNSRGTEQLCEITDSQSPPGLFPSGHPTQRKLTCSRRTCMATLQKGKHVTPRYLIRCFLNRSPENTVCSDMEGERDPSVKSSGQEGQSNNFRNGERFPCSLQGGEEQKAVHFRQLWVSPAVLVTAKVLTAGRATYTRTSCCCYVFSTLWFEIPFTEVSRAADLAALQDTHLKSLY